MIIYNVYWDDVFIGTLSVNNGKHRYIPSFEGIKKLEGIAPLVAQVKRPYDWGEKIPFFESRIINCERFGTEDYAYQTDHYRLEVLEKEKNIEEKDR